MQTALVFLAGVLAAGVILLLGIAIGQGQMQAAKPPTPTPAARMAPYSPPAQSYVPAPAIAPPEPPRRDRDILQDPGEQRRQQERESQEHWRRQQLPIPTRDTGNLLR